LPANEMKSFVKTHYGNENGIPNKIPSNNCTAFFGEF
jgi:hypothetical protein